VLFFVRNCVVPLKNVLIEHVPFRYWCQILVKYKFCCILCSEDNILLFFICLPDIPFCCLNCWAPLEKNINWDMC
jgi:hypothetical protein